MILVLLAAALEYRLPFNLPSQFGEQTILAVAFYMSGYLLKKTGFNFRQPAYRGLLLLALPAVVALFTHMGMVSGVAGWKVFAYYPVAMAGTVGTLVVSSCVSRVPSAKRVLGYIGSRTLYVLTFHFLAFKLVSYVYISFTARPLTDLAQSPVVQTDEAWLWLAYALVGTVQPLAVWELLNTFPAKLKAMVKTRITDKNNQI